MSIKVLQQCDTGGYVFRGDDKYLISTAQKEMIESLPVGDIRDLNVSIIETPTADKIISEASSAPFFASKRIVIVTANVKLFTKSDCENFLAFLKSNVSCCLCFVINEEGLDYREKEALNKCEFCKSVLKKVTVISCAKPSDAKAREIVLEEFLNGYSIGDGALSRLIYYCGNDMMRLKTECLKLKAYMGESKNIEVADVEGLKIDSFRYGDFALTDAVAHRDMNTAVRILDDMLLNNTADMLLPILQKQYRCALHAKLNAKMPLKEMAAFLGVGEMYLKNVMRVTQKESPASLKKKSDYLYKAEVDFKSGALDKRNVILNMLLYLLKGDEEWK